MNKLKERIVNEGRVLSESVLIVDSFLNHQMDPALMQDMGQTFAKHYHNQGITKVVTIESSGIAPAIFTALSMGVQLLTLKKQTSQILGQGVIQTPVHSFTKGLDYQLTVKTQFIEPTDKVLIIDDFLANGEAAMGAIRLVEQCGASVAGVGIVIEKSFQTGRQRLEEAGYSVYALARLAKLEADQITFVED